MFQNALKTAIGEINKDKIAIFGIRPNKPETGYGYLKISDAKKFMSFPQEVIEFVEKPTKDLAEKYLTEGTYFWNSGMFCFTAKTLQNNFEMHSSDIWNQSVEIYKNSKKLKNVTTFNSDDFSSLPNVSIDYSLIEIKYLNLEYPNFPFWRVEYDKKGNVYKKIKNFRNLLKKYDGY